MTYVKAYSRQNDEFVADAAAAIQPLVDQANSAASAAEAVAGPNYASTAAGLAATANGDAFAVDNGDGTVSIYLNNAGAAEHQRKLATTAALAGTGGAALIGASSGETLEEVVQRVITYPTTSGDSFRLGGINSFIDDTVLGSIVAGTYSATYPNKLGVNGAKPTVEPSTGARTAEVGYSAGGAGVSAILAGYDNVNNALAGILASQHSMLYAGADHATILGGSLNTILDDTDYSVILGGTNCTIQGRGRYAGIIASDQCKLITGASDTVSGFRSFIASSLSSTINGRNSAIIGGVAVTVSGTYSTVLNGSAVTVGASTVNVVVAGSNHTIGNSAAATNSLVIGNGHTLNGSRNLVVGDTHTSAMEYAVALGTGCVVPFHGAMVRSSRHRSNTAGNNMALDWQASQETADTTVTRLSAYGSSGYPMQPVNSVVTGTVWVTAVKSDGTSSAFKLDFSSVMGASGSPTIKGLTATVLHDDLALPTDPTIVATSTGIYRVQVVGLVDAAIRWAARFVGQQIVWT